mgnify:FL=1
MSGALEKLDRMLELLAEKERTFDELKAETSLSEETLNAVIDFFVAHNFAERRNDHIRITESGRKLLEL